jgi:tyrosinase
MVAFKSAVLLASAWLAGSALGALADIPKFTQADIDSGKAIKELGKIAFDPALARAATPTTGCTKDKVRIRREWRNMTMTDRKGYQEAVQCLMQKPSRNKGIDGARTAWDDYGVLHYYQTPYVHNSATFLLWHRHYNWVLEHDLETLCGYKGEWKSPGQCFKPSRDPRISC